jgi:hypothetical protein
LRACSDPRQPPGSDCRYPVGADPEDPLSLKLHIELVYDPGCPNIDAARDVLTDACREAGAPAVWTEWNSEDASCPPHARNLGSPSILVNGEDVAPGPHPWAERDPGQGPRCRVYRDGDAIVGAPPLYRVVDAIREALRPEVG